MTSKTVLKQQEWTDADLRKAGYRYYERKKQLVMARLLPAAEAPLMIKTTYDSLVVRAGYIICYDPGETVQMTLNSYPHWPVRPDLFEATYTAWDEPNWSPTPPQAHLINRGCKPYYKTAGIWAQRVVKPTYLQSLESPEPYMAPAGSWVAIGTNGEPWSMSDATLRQRYTIP